MQLTYAYDPKGIYKPNQPAILLTLTHFIYSDGYTILSDLLFTPQSIS